MIKILSKKFSIPQETLELENAYQISQRNVQKYFGENSFNSSTISRLMTDEFDYHGNNQNTIYVIDRESGKPAELNVSIERRAQYKYIVEEISLTDSKENLIGKKEYFLEYQRKSNTWKMYPGTMDTLSNKYAGVGARLDQIQIERANSLGIKKIPRYSVACATLYHTKAGYSPSVGKLHPILSIADIPKRLAKYLPQRCLYFLEENGIDILPVLVKKFNRFYIDENKTIFLANLRTCLKIIKETGEYRLVSGGRFCTDIELSGENLKHWMELIKGHEILKKLGDNFQSDVIHGGKFYDLFIKPLHK